MKTKLTILISMTLIFFGSAGPAFSLPFPLERILSFYASQDLFDFEFSGSKELYAFFDRESRERTVSGDEYTSSGGRGSFGFQGGSGGSAGFSGGGRSFTRDFDDDKFNNHRRGGRDVASDDGYGDKERHPPFDDDGGEVIIAQPGEYNPDGQQAAPVPEPAALILLGAGLAGLIGTRIRKK